MGTEDTLWQIEARLWTDGADYAETVLAPDAVMVFPYPAGILQGRAIRAGMDDAPRWRSVEIEDKVLTRNGPVALLAYRATAEREGQPVYEALCASSYLDDGGQWRLISHQQTPCA